MKQLIALFTLVTLSSSIQSQEKLTVQQGKKLAYSVSVNGQTFPMFASVDPLDNNRFVLTWNFEDGRSGRFIATKPSLDNARRGYWNQPIADEELVLPESQNIIMLSRSLFADLQKNKKAVFDEYNVTVKAPGSADVFKIKDKIIDAVYLEGEAGTKIWVLNNKDIPLILKIENNPFGVDIDLTGIE